MGKGSGETSDSAAVKDAIAQCRQRTQVEGALLAGGAQHKILPRLHGSTLDVSPKNWIELLGLHVELQDASTFCGFPGLVGNPPPPTDHVTDRPMNDS